MALGPGSRYSHYNESAESEDKLSLIQETIKESIADPSKLGAVLCVMDL